MKLMKLYKVTNGYHGNDYVHCLVIAPDEQAAIALASESFHRSADERARQHPTSPYDDRFWKPEGLEAEVIFDDLTTAQAGEPDD